MAGKRHQNLLPVQSDILLEAAEAEEEAEAGEAEAEAEAGEAEAAAGAEEGGEGEVAGEAGAEEYPRIRPMHPAICREDNPA